MKKFRLFHFVLYAKHFYHTSDLFNDVRKCLLLDGYQGLSRNEEVVRIVLDNCQLLTNQRAFVDFYQFANGITDRECWRNGYNTKTNNLSGRTDIEYPDYDYYSAILYYCMSNIVPLSPAELGFDEMPIPDYANCLPRPITTTNERLKQFFPTIEFSENELQIAE